LPSTAASRGSPRRSTAWSPIAGVRQRDGIVVHRSRALSGAEVERHDGISVTTPARTLLDIAGVLAPRPLERAVE
jgi:hypothetical protein